MLHGLRALDIAEERELAGRVTGILYLTGALTVSLMLLLPGVVTTHVMVVLALAGVGAAWALASLFLVPWQRASPLVSHLSSAMGFPITAIGVASTGGADSPARFYLLFIVVFAGYFYPPRAAAAYLVGCVGVHALPLGYDRMAVEEGFLAELLVIGPTYLALGGLIVAGKRLLVALRERAVELSRRDPLTGLANRRALIADLERVVGGRRTAAGLGLVLLDLDRFKDANTLFGHMGGDRVLREAAQAMRAAARDGDVVARLGGDEFAIVVANADGQSVAAVAERAVERIREADERLGLHPFRLSTSVGWALYPEDAGTAQDLLAAADAALCDAKAAGELRDEPHGATGRRSFP